MYAPVRLEIDAERGVDLTTHSEMSEKAKTSPLDVNKVFKEQSDQRYYLCNEKMFIIYLQEFNVHLPQPKLVSKVRVCIIID